MGRPTLVISHEESARPGLVGDRLVERGFALDVHVTVPDTTRPGAARELPPLDGYDLVVSTGSYWSVYDTKTIGAWIDDEIELLRAAHEGGTPVLGICFGGQALAAALGGGVQPATITEIGWYGIDPDPSWTPPGPWIGGPWMEWHHDRFAVPPDAEVLASSAAGPQLFRVGHSLGTQFHPEVTHDLVAEWLSSAADDYLATHGVVRETLLAAVAEHETANRTNCAALVDWFLDDVAALT